MLDKQQTFDRVLAHLRAQGVPASDGGKCCYRTEDGRMCAVGCLIPDEEYDPGIEGNAARDVLDYIPGADLEDAGFLGCMQMNMHDNPVGRSEGDKVAYQGLVESGAQYVAKAYGLTYKEPTNA
jgi:hypothetical protein